MRYQVTRRTCLLCTIAVLVLAQPYQLAHGDDTESNTLQPGRMASVDAVFSSMAAILPGKWRGVFADGTADKPTGEWGDATVEYELTAGDTALIENYVDSEGRPYMTTVYHKDNNDLRATHFCGAQNHPRMIARTIDPNGKEVEFDFVDVANLQSADSYHSRGLVVQLVSDNAIILTFKGLEDGEESSRVFKLQKED